MVLSNAERQARYRRNLKARATDPSEALRSAVDAAIVATWEIYRRMWDAGRRCAEIADVESLDDWRRCLIETADHNPYGNPTLPDYAESLLDEAEFATEAELSALRAVVGARDALSMKHHPRPKRAKGKK